MIGGILGNHPNSPYQNLAQSNAAAQMTAPTLASAAGQMDQLNERLGAVIATVAKLSDSIGGPRPVSGESGKPQSVAPSGIVNQMHESVSEAHRRVSSVEDILSAISRSLG